MCANTLWLFSSSTRNIALGRDSRMVPSSTMASSFGLGRVGLFRTLVAAAQKLLRTREADLGRSSMLPPGKVNAKRRASENQRRADVPTRKNSSDVHDQLSLARPRSAAPSRRLALGGPRRARRRRVWTDPDRPVDRPGDR